MCVPLLNCVQGGGVDANNSDAEEAAELMGDEAGADGTISDNDFMRGKRFRKLHRLLSSPVVSERVSHTATAFQHLQIPTLHHQPG
jgi:hypothetical protein